ncbi:MAG: NUDIX hydrolase [Bacteroidales bacterium]|nr:NUDIX hydrolase [Bacteroidales bacterium]
MESEKYSYTYPHPAVTADCVVFGWDGRSLKVLLVKRGNDPFRGFRAFPGGFMDIEESAIQCAARELEEETGVSGLPLEQFHVFSTVNRDPRERVVTVSYLSLVRLQELEPQAGDDAADVLWAEVDRLSVLAFDHARMMRLAVRHLWRKLHLAMAGMDTCVEYRLDDTEIRQVYNKLGRLMAKYSQSEKDDLSAD